MMPRCFIDLLKATGAPLSTMKGVSSFYFLLNMTASVFATARVRLREDISLVMFHRRGPTTEPWGTPHNTATRSFPSVAAGQVATATRSLKYDCSRFLRYGEIS